MFSSKLYIVLIVLEQYLVQISQMSARPLNVFFEEKIPVGTQVFTFFQQDGGEMYFSDIYADRDLPQEVRNHKVLWGKALN